MKDEELKVLRTKLKQGEYDGADIMKAWIAIDRLIKVQTTLKNVHDKLEYGDVYQWDDGDNCWEEMRRLCV